jgi:hypothetical protein
MFGAGGLWSSGDDYTGLGAGTVDPETGSERGKAPGRVERIDLDRGGRSIVARRWTDCRVDADGLGIVQTREGVEQVVLPFPIWIPRLRALWVAARE